MTSPKDGMAGHFWAITEDLPTRDGKESVGFSCAYCWVSLKVSRDAQSLPGGRAEPTDEELREREIPIRCKEGTVYEVMES